MSGFLSVLVSYGATAVKAAYQKIIASDTASQAGANFGSAVALSGDGNYIVVGSYLAGSTDEGAVYVYYNNNGTWEEQTKLVASNAVAGDWFGCAVDITKTGDRIIVGAQHANALPYNQDNSGAAYIFQRTGTTWTEEVYISGGDGGSNDYFGSSVAINDDGTAIFIGAYGDDDSNSSSVGFIHTYTRNGLSWSNLNWKNDDTELPTTASEGNAYHGWSVACNGDGTRCIEGGPGDNNQGKTNSGVVTIHHRASISAAWTKDIWLEPPYPSNDGQFGWSVAMDATGERVVIGAMGENPTGIVNAGAAYVYKRTGTVWALETQLTASDKSAGDNFGYSVSINAAGDKVTIGSLKTDIPTKTDAGAAYVFERSGTSWIQLSKLTAGDAITGDNLGSAISVNDIGDAVVVGSMNNDPLGSINAGAAYYFPMLVKQPVVWTTNVDATYTLPVGTTTVMITASGGGGGGGSANYSSQSTISANGGNGGSATSIVSTHTLPAGTTALDIIIGKGGNAITGSTSGAYPIGGIGKYNGGNGGANSGSSSGGAGGGATSVSAGSTILVVAGGAGGGGGGASSRPGAVGASTSTLSTTTPATNGTDGHTGNAGGGGGGANGGIGGTSGADNGATAQGGTAGTLSYNSSTVNGIPTTKTNTNNGLGEKTGQPATAGGDGFVTITII